MARFARSERRQRLLEHLARIGLRAHAARELIGDVEALRQAVEPGRALVGEPLGSRRPPQRLAQEVVRLHHRVDVGRRDARGAQHPDDPFARTLELGARRLPRFRRCHQRLRHLLQIALGGEEALGQPLDQRGRRLIGDEMARELGGYVFCGCRMACERGEHVASLLHAGVGVAPPDHRLRAGLVHARIELELAAAHRVLAKRHERPAGDHIGETGDVLLGVDRAHTQRMQFEDLARQIFVEAAFLPQPGNRVGADRARIVEIDEHRRMGFGGQQHVAEAAEHVRADDLAFIGAANLAHVALVRRHAEMVRPEPDEPLEEADLGAERGLDARLGFREINLLRHPGTRIAHWHWRRRRRGLIVHLRQGSAAARRGGLLRGAFGLARRPLRLLEGECDAGGGAARQQIRIADAAGARAIQFREQRAAGIRRNARNRSGAWTEAEPVQGKRSLRFRIRDHASSSFRSGPDATAPPATSSAAASQICGGPPFAIMAMG